jgi:hypothetical protein
MNQPATVKENSDLIAKLYQKVGKVIEECERIPKNGHNDFHNYDYATESDIVEHVRKSMVENHLSIIFNPTGHTVTEKTSEKGKKTNLYTLNLEFRVIDTETGYFEIFPWMGQGEDSGDKGMYKAYTGGQKYFLMKFFMIPTGDDPEEDKTAPPKQPNQKDNSEKDRPKGNFESFMKKFDEAKSEQDLDNTASLIGKYRFTVDEFNTLKGRYLSRKNELKTNEKPTESPVDMPEGKDLFNEYKKQLKAAHDGGDNKLKIEIMKAARTSLGDQYKALAAYANALVVGGRR